MWDPSVPTDLLKALLDRLPYEPASLYRAVELLGDDQWFGWSIDTTKAADVADMTLLDAKASATNPKARLTDKERSPRPQPRRRQPTSLMQDFSRFLM